MGKNHYGRTTGKTFRLSVCLKRFFSDERARCYITADAGLRFRWLAARLRRLFALRGAFCLVTRGHLLPPDEPVGLLAANDLVEVIPKHYKIFPDTSESDVSERSNKSDIEDEANEKQGDILPAEIGDIQEQKGEHDVDKLLNTASQSSNVDVSNKCSIEEQGLLEEKNETIQKISSNSNDVESGQFEEIEKEKLDEVKKQALKLLDQLGAPPKRKRKRVRRRKQHAFVQEPTGDTDDAAGSEDVCDGADQSPPSRRRCAPSREPVTESQTNTARVNDILEKSTSPGLVDTDSLILRNNTEHSHSARLVRSLS